MYAQPPETLAAVFGAPSSRSCTTVSRHVAPSSCGSISQVTRLVSSLAISSSYIDRRPCTRRRGAELAEAGVLIDCAPLQPVTASTTVRVRGGETLLTDGPAAEIKEHFGGYTLIECADLDEALRWAAKMPAATGGSVEVRPLIEPEPPAAATSGEPAEVRG